MNRDHGVRRCTTHRRRGDSQISFEPSTQNPLRKSPQRTPADRIPVVDIMSKELICASPQLELSELIALMAYHRIGCMPIVDERRHPVGIVTKFDLLEHLDAQMQSLANGSPMPTELAARVADEVMMPIPFVLQDHATIAHAAATMSIEDTHHVLVVRDSGELVGVVSSKDLVDWLVTNDGLAPRRS